MGYAAARFGHVMFPENVHEPALNCAELLLEGVGKGQCVPFLLPHLNYKCFLLGIYQIFSEGEFSTKVRSLPYNLEVMSSNIGNSLSACKGMIAWEPRTLGCHMFLLEICLNCSPPVVALIAQL